MNPLKIDSDDLNRCPTHTIDLHNGNMLKWFDTTFAFEYIDDPYAYPGFELSDETIDVCIESLKMMKTWLQDRTKT